LTGVLRHNAPHTAQSSTNVQQQRLTLDSNAALTVLQSLICLSHVFSWVPLQTAATHAPASLLNKVFHFATLGQANCRQISSVHVIDVHTLVDCSRHFSVQITNI